MTEGIIQEVLKDCECDACKAGLDTLHNNERRRFKQELIEKIKQESFDIEFKTYEYRPVIFTSKLIGDNE